MHDAMLRDILRRLNALERTSARVRVGEVTGVNPLDVALGGATTSYEDVQTVDGGMSLDIGDQIAALIWGNDLIVLGRSGAGGMRFGSSTLSFAAATSSSTQTVTHDLGVLPSAVLATTVGAAAFGNIPTYNIVGNTTTQFTINGEVKAAFTGSVTFYWIAVA